MGNLPKNRNGVGGKVKTRVTKVDNSVVIKPRKKKKNFMGSRKDRSSQTEIVSVTILGEVVRFKCL